MDPDLLNAALKEANLPPVRPTRSQRVLLFLPYVNVIITIVLQIIIAVKVSPSVSLVRPFNVYAAIAHVLADVLWIMFNTIALRQFDPEQLKRVVPVLLFGIQPGILKFIEYAAVLAGQPSPTTADGAKPTAVAIVVAYLVQPVVVAAAYLILLLIIRGEPHWELYRVSKSRDLPTNIGNVRYHELTIFSWPRYYMGHLYANCQLFSQYYLVSILRVYASDRMPLSTVPKISVIAIAVVATTGMLLCIPFAQRAFQTRNIGTMTTLLVFHSLVIVALLASAVTRMSDVIMAPTPNFNPDPVLFFDMAPDPEVLTFAMFTYMVKCGWRGRNRMITLDFEEANGKYEA